MRSSRILGSTLILSYLVQTGNPWIDKGIEILSKSLVLGTVEPLQGTIWGQVLHPFREVVLFSKVTIVYHWAVGLQFVVVLFSEVTTVYHYGNSRICPLFRGCCPLWEVPLHTIRSVCSPSRHSPLSLWACRRGSCLQTSHDNHVTGDRTRYQNLPYGEL